MSRLWGGEAPAERPDHSRDERRVHTKNAFLNGVHSLQAVNAGKRHRERPYLVTLSGAEAYDLPRCAEPIIWFKSASYMASVVATPAAGAAGAAGAEVGWGGEAVVRKYTPLPP